MRILRGKGLPITALYPLAESLCKTCSGLWPECSDGYIYISLVMLQYIEKAI
jgi:hypothetical protein